MFLISTKAPGLLRGVAATAAASILWLAAAATAAAERLTFLTWADYLDPELVEEFTRESGIGIDLSYFESDDHRDELMVESDGRGYDLAMVNGLMLSTYAQRNWLAPVEVSVAPNIRHIYPRWRDAFEGSSRYGVPYFWGTLGIAYRTDLVPVQISRWEQFFKPEARLHGRISMLKNARDVVGMALKTLGESANSEDRGAIRRAGELLLAQRPYVRSYEYVSLSEESALVSGEVWAAMMYSGDALMVQSHESRIRYVVPEEGSNLWVDYLVVMQASPRVDLAMRFIDFLNRPEIAARNAEFVYYATPNSQAERLLPAEHLQDPVIYPGQPVMDRSESYREIAPRAQKTLNDVFANLLR